MNSSARRSGALVLAATVLGGIGSYAMFPGSAEALPAAQGKCVFGLQGVTTDDGWKSLGLQVSLDNGTKARRVVAQYAGDMGVETNSEIRIGYSIDGGPVQEKVYGPGNLANHQEFWETKSTIAVMRVAKGSHTIEPFFRISGSPGKSGAFEGGCFTVEGRSK